MPEPYDVCVIGSGAGGGTLAATLARKGARVALIEGGSRRDPAKLHTHDWPWQERPPDVPPVYADSVKEPLIYHGDRIDVSRARVLGGRTTHWNAVSLRFSANDFREWSVSGIEEDWPLSYEQIAPYYDAAERLMVISGTKENLEVLPDGQFIKPMALRCSEKILRRAARKFDISVIPVRKAIATEPGHGRLPCHYCGHCMEGCGVAAIFNTAEHVIPSGRDSGRLDVYTDWMAHELIADEEAIVRSARLVERGGSEEMEVKAGAFAVCCGNIESSRLLLNSKSPRFPNGLANNNDVVGRYLHGHIHSDVFGYLEELAGADLPDQTGAIDHAYIPRFKPFRKVDYTGGFGFQLNVRAYDRPHHAYHLRGFGSPFKKRVRELMPALSNLSGFGKVLARPRNRVTLHPTRKDGNGLPVPVVDFRWDANDLAIHADMLETAHEIYDEAGVAFRHQTAPDSPVGFASHEVGTCRMGKDPKTSVLNGLNQAHEVRNLFVVDGSSFTSFPEKNPTLTIVALALRAADTIFELKRRGEV